MARGHGGTEQLFSVGDLMAKGNVKSIVDFLKDFKDKNRFNEIGYEEAGQVLKQAVKLIRRFSRPILMSSCEVFLIISIICLGLLKKFGMTKSRSIGREFWGLYGNSLTKMIFGRRKIRSQKQCVSIRIGKDSIPSAIADLIEKGVKNDEWVMPDDCLPDVHKILTQLLEKVESSAKGRDSDALNEAINSPKGHVIQTFINYALCQCRVYEKKCQNKGIKRKRRFLEDAGASF